MTRIHGLRSFVIAPFLVLFVVGQQADKTDLGASLTSSSEIDVDMQKADEATQIAEQVAQESGEESWPENNAGAPTAKPVALLRQKAAPVVSVMARKSKKHSNKGKRRHGSKKHNSRKKVSKSETHHGQPDADGAVDAANAHKAAETAQQAANVANEVAKHSIHLTSHAKSALKSAKDAVHKARTETEGLSSDQKTYLEHAESRLKEATKDAEYGALKDARYANITAENHDLSKLQDKLDKAEKKRRVTELEQMGEELKQLREDLKKKTGRDAAASEDQLAEEKQIEELESMIKKLEEQEASLENLTEGSKSHDELKVEMEKLREAVDRLETKRLEYSLPKKVEEAEEGVSRGKLVHELPKSGKLVHELPPLSDEESSGEAGTPSVDSKTDSDSEAVTPLGGIDVDTEMPYGDLEPFGREDTAQELTESSIRESDQMVDQLERAEVAEEKRAVFRALTRLRGAAITSFDGVARSQTGNIDEYNKVHKWRNSHPLHHLADEESDISKWAFPDNADFF